MFSLAMCLLRFKCEHLKKWIHFVPSVNATHRWRPVFLFAAKCHCVNYVTRLAPIASTNQSVNKLHTASPRSYQLQHTSRTTQTTHSTDQSPNQITKPITRRQSKAMNDPSSCVCVTLWHTTNNHTHGHCELQHDSLAIACARISGWTSIWFWFPLQINWQ